MPPMASGVLPLAELRKYADLGAQEQFHLSPGRRDLLFADISREFRLTVPLWSRPHEQVLSDLIHLNLHPEFLCSYLEAAAWLTKKPVWQDALADAKRRLATRGYDRKGMTRDTPDMDEAARGRLLTVVLSWVGWVDAVRAVWRKRQARWVDDARARSDEAERSQTQDEPGDDTSSGE